LRSPTFYPLSGPGSSNSGWLDKIYNALLLRGRNPTDPTYDNQLAFLNGQSPANLANARLTWFSPDDKLSVSGFVNNLTDRRYQVHGRPNGTAGQYVITYGDPRTVGLSVTSRF